MGYGREVGVGVVEVKKEDEWLAAGAAVVLRYVSVTTNRPWDCLRELGAGIGCNDDEEDEAEAGPRNEEEKGGVDIEDGSADDGGGSGV